jgi:hypothetical protein
MATFIHEVLKDLQNKKVDFATTTFIVPSKRAGVILKFELSKIVSKTIFVPIITSIETFTEDLSQLKSVSNTELLFKFYNTYKHLAAKKNADSFEMFSKWAQILLQDFNEIDRFLIPQEKIFNYLSSIQDLKHWSLEDNQTEFIKNYLSFWRKLHTYYLHFTEQLINEGLAYQGLIYRESIEHLEAYIQKNKKHVFLGFNALNTAEEIIIQELLSNDLAEIYWDTDQVYVNNKQHDASLFIEKYKKNWSYYKTHSFNWTLNNYSKQKNVCVYGVPKNVGQAKQIGKILEDIIDQNKSLGKTAVVLADENLLIPVLNSIPLNIENINITMGLPLHIIPLASLFELLFLMHKKASKEFYYKNVITLLTNKFIHILFKDNCASNIISIIENENIIYISKEQLLNLSPSNEEVIDILFSNWENPKNTLNFCFKLINLIKRKLQETKRKSLLQLEYLYRYNELFNELSRLNLAYNHIKDITTLYNIYKELLHSETLDFKGEPLQGLQIMGMLESRVLDFETIIISSVNEGVLPSGKSNNSFIPFDVKIENNLPTYKEKDAVYTYHFYRLIQRAKNVFIIYNTEIDTLKGGEKSRFISQLEIEGIHKIKHTLVTPKVSKTEITLNTIKKTEAVMLRLKEVSEKGFSPSSLTNYIRNPLGFYYQKILKINTYEDVEETVANNTLGTVVHNTLEDLYKPLINKYLTIDSIKNMKPNVPEIVTHHFKNEYKQGDITKGKNLIIFEIAKQYVLNFLNLEIADLKEGNTIKILDIEAENNKVKLNIPELNFPVYLNGKVDRVDEYNNTIRIIDYKTGRVNQNKVEIVDWENITLDYDKYSKSFQVLAYAYMLNRNKPFTKPVEAGIISFKNLKAGFIKFAKKETVYSRSKETIISKETLNAFELELKKLILEICNPKIDFIEKEV